VGEGRATLKCCEQILPHQNSDCHTREAVHVDRSQKLEESNTMFRELRKVLVDHVERRLKDCLENRRDLRRE
jgi:hypothetical protein